MPSHPERVRRNYPEGVPAFGSAIADPWNWERDYLGPARAQLLEERDSGQLAYESNFRLVQIPGEPQGNFSCEPIASPEQSPAPVTEPPAVLNPSQAVIWPALFFYLVVLTVLAVCLIGIWSTK